MRSSREGVDTQRRGLIRGVAGLALAASPFASLAATTVDDGIARVGGPRPLVSYPGKRDLLLVTSRPPHLETPFGVFNDGPITPNDAFYVRYHLAGIPTSIDPDTFRLKVSGAVKSPLSLSLQDLKAIGTTEVVAINQCSGNSRGYSSPRVFGAQLGNGSMGCARWTGVPLQAVLAKAGVAAGTRTVTFNGLDKPVLPVTPDFIKSLDIDHALSPEPLLAWGMNGEDLPFLNGYPLKLIVPGWFGTYWVKHLSEIEVLDHAFEGHDSWFMNTAYRLPDNDCMCVDPGTTPDRMRPISTLPTRSFITSIAAGAAVPAGRSMVLKGIAFDAGSGIRTVAVSIDGGKSWKEATLGKDIGRYAFREWTAPVTFAARGAATLMVRATSISGETQPMTATWNPGGYRRHVVESVPVTVT